MLKSGKSNCCDVDDNQHLNCHGKCEPLESRKNKKVAIIKEIMPCYTDEWFSNYKNWIEFTKAFKNTFHGKYYDVYDKICSKFAKYDAKNNRDMWDKLDHVNSPWLNISSIRYWAREQNPKLYESTVVEKNEDKLKALKKLVKEKYTKKWMGKYKNWYRFTMAFKSALYGNNYEVWYKIMRKMTNVDKEMLTKRWSQIPCKINSKYNYESFEYWADKQEKLECDK